MRKYLSRIALVYVLALPSAFADVALDVHGGTLGVGVGLTLGITEQINVRGLVNVFSHDVDEEASDIDYEFDLELESVGALIDWHPGGGHFRLSAGAFVNNNSLDGVGVPNTPTVEIGNAIFNTADVGILEANLDFNDIAPYVGIGWGNAVGENRRWVFNLDIGVLFQGNPNVEFRSVGANPLLQPLIDAEIEAEQQDIQDDVDDYELYPVVSIGLSYKF